MPVRYRNSPLVEAIFEIFVDPRAWSQATVERLTAELAVEYAGPPELMRSSLTLEVKMTPEGQSAKAIQGPQDRIRLWNLSRTRMVQFGANMCAFNALPPYESFPDHLPELHRLYGAFLRESRAETLRSVGQRYINRVNLPAVEADPSQYFTLYPKRVWPSGDRHPPLALQIVTGKLSAGQVVLNLVYEGIHDGQPRYLLDLYARWEDGHETSAQWESVESWQREAHELIFQSFEAALTPPAKELLGREELT